MKVVLTRPNYHSHLITPQLGMGYISSYINKRGFDATIIDGLNLDLSVQEIADCCHDADVVGIGCLTDFFSEVIALSRELKKRGKVVVIGGPHATVLPEVTLRKTGADYVIVGEGEITFYELLLAMSNNQPVDGIEGVVTPTTNGISRRASIENLDDIPFPDWKQMDPRYYMKAPHGGLVKNFPVAPITSTRGCPYSCTFCASPEIWGKTIRWRSPANVVDEIEYLVKVFGVKEIHFEDDNLTLKISHVEEICRLIIKRNINISWATPNGIRADKITPEVLKLMKESGCYLIAFGIESGNPEILKNIKKMEELETMTYAVNEASKLGIITQGFFIFGLPGETEETVQETIDYAKKIPLDKAQFLLLDVLPGTQLWKDHKGEFEHDLQKRSYQELTWVPDTVEKEVLEKAPARAFRSFFFRPRQILMLLRFMKVSQFKFILRRILDFGIIPYTNK